MFLFNMFGGGFAKPEVQKYDKISFKISLADNIPHYYESSSDDPQEQIEITPDHPLYHELFLEPPKQNFVEYKVKPEDTIIGIAFRLNLSEKLLRSINNISDSLYPGMTIKLPMDTDLSLLENNPVIKIQEKGGNPLPNAETSTTRKYNKVQYFTKGKIGKVAGTLTVSESYIIFNPWLEESINLKEFTVEKLLKFNALIELGDIHDILAIQIPEIEETQGDSEDPIFNAVLQLTLYRVGNNQIQRKYKERLKQLKLTHKPIASVSFSFPGQPEGFQTCQEIVNFVKSSIDKLAEKSSEQDTNKLTSVQYFDILHQNLQTKDQKIQQKHNIIKESALLGKMSEESLIINEVQFGKLVKNFPILYQLYNWNRAYLSSQDGTSFSTFLNRVQNEAPVIMLIKEYKGFLFGAYIAESLECGKTGRGQMFLFTFMDTDQPTIYKWTGNNDFFVFIEKDSGIGIGMGFSYGLFLKNTLDKGSSAPTKTFDSPQLSLKENFIVEEVELWIVENSL